MTFTENLVAIGDCLRQYEPWKSGQTYFHLPGISPDKQRGPTMLDGIGAAVSVAGSNAYDSGYNQGYTLGNTDGFARGYDQGESDGILSGRQAEWETFWGVYQQDGSRVDYNNAFCGSGWTNITFRPKFSFHLKAANYMFMACGFEGDLAAHLASCGVALDTADATSLISLFSWAQKITNLPPLTVGTIALVDSFNGCMALQELSLQLDGTVTFTRTVDNCPHLATLHLSGSGNIDGTVNVSGSPRLTHDSLVTLITYLKDGGGTLTLGSNRQKLSDEEIAVATAKGWTVV